MTKEYPHSFLFFLLIFSHGYVCLIDLFLQRFLLKLMIQWLQGLASSRVLGSEEDMLGFENLQGRRTLTAIPPVFFT
jgi:hypothetical protein